MNLIKNALPLLLSASAMLLVTSCDSDYDLTKDIDTTVQVGNNFTIPVGNTVKFNLSRIIKPSDDLKVNNSGVYELTANGVINSHINQVNKVSITGLDPLISSVDVALTQAPSSDYTFTVPIAADAHYDSDTELPKEVQSIYSLEFGAIAGGKVTAKLRVSLPVERFLKKAVLSNVKLELPSIFVIEESGSNILSVSKIELSNDKNAVEIPFTIAKALIPAGEQSKYIVDKNGRKHFVLSGSLNVSGIADFNVNPSLIDKENTKIDFSLVVPEAEVTAVSGKMLPDVNINEQLSVESVPDFIKGDGSNFVPSDMQFRLNLNNPVNMQLSTVLRITPMSYQTGACGRIVRVPIDKVKANEMNRFVISNAPCAVASNEVNIVVPELTDLLAKIPDYYVITSEQIVADCADSSQQFVLGKDYQLNGGYDLTVPFTFTDLTIDYTDSFDGLKEDLDDVSDMTAVIEINAEAVTTIPADMVFGVKLLDEYGNELKEINVDLQQVDITGAKDNGAETVSPIKIVLTVPEGSTQFEQLERIEYNVKAKKAEGLNLVTLRSDQYLSIRNITAKLPNGITKEL